MKKLTTDRRTSSRRERDLEKKLERTKEALRKAILSTGRVYDICVDFDAAGSTFEVMWNPEVIEWAELADLDLSKHQPTSYY